MKFAFNDSHTNSNFFQKLNLTTLDALGQYEFGTLVSAPGPKTY